MRRYLAWIAAFTLPWAPRAGGDERPTSKDDVITIQGQIVHQDVPDKRRRYPCKIHALTLAKGNTYVIDLLSKAFDPYLRIEDSKGNNLAEDDDSGGELQSRLTFRPTADDVYQLIATSYSGGAGAYTLRIRRVDAASLPKTVEPRKN